MANPYLTEPIFAPVPAEQTFGDLRVTGTLPPELDGRYLRNGPNPIGPVDPVTAHWFIGAGMVHGLRLRGGRAEWYRNRYVRSRNVTEALGEPEVPGPHHGDMSGSVNTNIVGIGGRFFALVEAGSYPVELDGDLTTLRNNDFDGTLAGAYTAHPKVHGPTGDLHAVTYYWPEEAVHHVVVDGTARVIRDVTIPVGGRPMVHDTAVTDTQVLLFDLPVQFDVEVAMAGGFPYVWEEGRAARVGLLPVDGGADDVTWCEVDPCYVFHPGNARDLPDGSVQVDVVRHPSMFRTERLGPNEGPSVMARWTLDPAGGKVREEVVDDRAVEFPRFDDRRTGGDVRYEYTANVHLSAGADGSLVRYDMSTGDALVWSPGAGRTVGEFVFVPREGSGPNGAEDDGWLLGLVHDLAGGDASLAVLAADDLAAGPVATVEIPTHVPLGFHGNWIPEA